MVIRVFYFVVSIFSVAMVYLSMQEPYENHTLKPDASIAGMMINDVIDYEINKEMIKARYEADEWNRYQDRDEILKFKTEFIRDGLEHNASSDKVVHKNDVLNFNGNFRYTNAKGLKFASEEVIYDLKAKIASSSTPFVLFDGSSKVMGDSIIYDTIMKTTYAKGIRAWIEEKR